MNFNKKIAVSLDEIKKQIERGDTGVALESLDRLWQVVSRVGRNEESLSCSYLHSKETLEDAKRENKIIEGSIQLLHEIVLKK